MIGAKAESEVPIVRHDDCRACKGKLEKVADFGKQKTISLGDKPSIVAPLVLMKCDDCGLVQLRDTVDRDFLFRKYYYRSGATKTMRDHLKGIVEDVMKRVELTDGDVVVDIGSNDGTLMGFYPEKVIKVGYDPAAFPIEPTYPENSVVETNFFKGRLDWVSAKYWNWPTKLTVPIKAKVITAIAMFYDLEDPNAFLQDVKKVLAPDGLFILQVNYLPDVLKNNSVGDICHEHLEYYSLTTLDRLLKSNDFLIDSYTFSPINGGSVILFVKHYPEGEEIPTGDFGAVDVNLDIHAFESRVKDIAMKLYAFVSAVQASGKSVALVGASTRVATLMQLARLDGYGKINWVVERDASKVGLHYLGIPITGEAADAEKPADYYILGPTWFTKEVMERMSHVKHWIVPLPIPKVVVDGKEMLL